ncbi:hypothetical protein PLANPX_0378 [Lacipirellula parvula]|uniref:Uncharacterized protein n=1 Tax=Lacipirellula parvula TaxID=2650471 RepID=A0A5K7X8Z0_9BACT|nr:hypothetical protein PLANPX_0378 [Lacipirellula parvula]
MGFFALVPDRGGRLKQSSVNLNWWIKAISAIVVSERKSKAPAWRIVAESYNEQCREAARVRWLLADL